MIGLYLTHPQVEIDPNIPVPNWRLSDRGRARVEAILDRRWLRDIGRIVTSEERKAIETAEIITGVLGISSEVAPAMGENDRSSTGFLEPPAFEAAADRFFTEPDVSWSGWERAVDAQARIATVVDRILEGHDPTAMILFVGHGAVGTLLKCHLTGRAISRAEDQPAGGGNIYAFALAGLGLLCDWVPMERFEGVRDGS